MTNEINLLPPYPTRIQKTKWYKYLDKEAVGNYTLVMNNKTYKIELSESHCLSYFYISFLLKCGRWSTHTIILKIKLTFNLEKNEVTYNERFKN